MRWAGAVSPTLMEYATSSNMRWAGAAGPTLMEKQKILLRGAGIVLVICGRFYVLWRFDEGALSD